MEIVDTTATRAATIPTDVFTPFLVLKKFFIIFPPH